jgi:AcrR family transcriptional regulator
MLEDKATAADEPSSVLLPGNGRALTRKGVASGNEVLRAAADAFLARGYAATSIDDIADRLGCTKGRVYHYFRSKGEIYLGIHRLALETSIRTVEPLAAADKPAVERIYDMAYAHAQLMMSETGFMRLAGMNAEMHLASEGRTREAAVQEIFTLRDQYEALFVSVVEEGRTAGEFREESASILAKALLGSLNWISVWFNPSADRDRAQQLEIARVFAEFIADGLRVR